MFSNKHIVVALLVTPVLAVLAWFTVGSLVGEKPRRAVPGQSYPLVERSNCRYDSGQCDLRNEDMRLSVTLQGDAALPSLVLTADRPLEGALLAVAGGDQAAAPDAMLRDDSAGQRWRLPLDSVPGPEQRLRIVVQAAGSHWFADASTVFLARYREPAAGE